MPRRLKVRARLTTQGVDIIDQDGTMLTGITNQDAVDLLLSLMRNAKAITRRARLDAGIPAKRR